MERRFYLWRAVDHEGEVLECFVTKRRNKAAAKKFLIKAMRKHGSPKIITTDKLPSYGAAFREIGVADKQLCGGRSNNRCENSHLPFRRRERAMQLFKTAATLQRFVSYHSQIYNHFNHERHLQNRQTYKQKRTTRSHGVVPNLRFIGLCDRGTLRHVRLCLTTPPPIPNKWLILL